MAAALAAESQMPSLVSPAWLQERCAPLSLSSPPLCVHVWTRFVSTCVPLCLHACVFVCAKCVLSL